MHRAPASPRSSGYIGIETNVQGVFCSTFDQTGTRLITGGADKTIKIYNEVA